MTLNFLKGPLNQHIELTRLSGAVVIPAAIALTAVHLWRDHAFSITEFGAGMALVIGSVAGGAAIKDTASAKVTQAASDPNQGATNA